MRGTGVKNKNKNIRSFYFYLTELDGKSHS